MLEFRACAPSIVLDNFQIMSQDIRMSDSLDDRYEALLLELHEDSTSGERLDQIASEHLQHDFQCELCEYFREADEMIAPKIARHSNCKETTLDKLIEWGNGRGDPGWEVDLLIAACSRRNFSGKWYEYVLDSGWSYRLQFEGNLHYHFISVLMKSHELSESEKKRILEANDGLETFPTEDELRDMGYL